MGFINKIFGGDKNKLPKELAKEIVTKSYLISSDVVNSMEEVQGISLFRMTLGLTEGLIGATDRIAHGMNLQNRYEVMETLIDESSKIIVELFLDKKQINTSEGIERIKSEIHTAHLYLGQFPMQSSDGSAGGTFAWEMSKMIAKDIDKENDIVMMSLIQDLYVATLTEVKPKSHLSKL